MRDEVKYGRLLAFAAALPKIREHTAADLKRAGLPREKVLATVVELLEKTLIRVGNEEYARDNNSYGLTTMRVMHAKVNGSSVRFEFRGKSGKSHSIGVQDARLARIVKACRDLPGYELFQYVDDAGERKAIESSDVNDICGRSAASRSPRRISGRGPATVYTACELAHFPPHHSKSAAKKNIVKAIEAVATRLGNTTAVCRKSYIHPAVVDAYMDGDAIRPSKRRLGGSRLSPQEAAVVNLIARWSKRRSTSKAA